MDPFISERGTDLCVICKADTGIPTDTHIDMRAYYVDGVGQLCSECGDDE